MHSKSDNMSLMTYNNANEVIKGIFESHLSRYQIGLETSMKSSDFIFDGVRLLYFKCYKIKFKRGGSYIDSPDWIKKKNAATNSKNKNDECFQYAATVALNHGEIKWNSESFSNIKTFINKLG